MRIAMMVVCLVLTQVGPGVYASDPVSPASTRRALILKPTLVQELNELRINTGTKAVLGDGTMNAVYVKKTPAEGNTYLNFHVDVASEGGSFVLHSEGIRLERAVVNAAASQVAATTLIQSYTPFDWFVDTGLEVRGDPLTVNDKAIVQFTIEVPRAGHDHLVLFVHSQRIGTVGEIREEIARESKVQ